MAVKPITPDEVDKTKVIPSFVIDAFNYLINKRFSEKGINNGVAIVYQNEIISEIILRAADPAIKVHFGPVNEGRIFQEGWLNVEDMYRKAGWQVKYDRPVAYAGENYEPFFEFTK